MTVHPAPWNARLAAYVRLPHPWAVLIVMLATALFGLLATSGNPDPLRFWPMLGAMLGGQLAIGALNEYRDRELDALTKPHRPIPSGLVSPGGALGMVVLGGVLMAAAGLSLGPRSLLVIAAGTGCGIVYDLWFKGTTWSWLPYLIALPLLPTWVWLTMERPEPALLLLYPLGAPMVLAVHLAQSLPDAESDRAAGVGSLVARLGARRTLLSLAASCLFACAEVALFSVAFGERPAPGLVAAALVVAGLSASLVLRRAWPDKVDEQLFKVITALTVILGAGLVLSLGI
jgi:4-hydroxybenzoate polyprenyltransferase/geranylgeranylglycerol-phosphate geranylgeranyltransferase